MPAPAFQPRGRRRRPARAPDLGADVLVTDKELYRTIRPALEGCWKRRASSYVFIGDGFYVRPSLKELEALLKASLEDRPDYISEIYDCDDFAWRFKAFATQTALSNRKPAAYAVGVIWRWPDEAGEGGHAYNWVLTLDGGLRFIEPQNGSHRALDKSLECRINLVCG